MKKLGKILINSEKVIKNDELLNLKGGTYNYTCDLYGSTCDTICVLPNGIQGVCRKYSIGPYVDVCACFEV